METHITKFMGCNKSSTKKFISINAYFMKNSHKQSIFTFLGARKGIKEV